MINKWVIMAVFLFVPLFMHAKHLQEYDSIGVKTINGKVIIIHRVKKGETLYSLSRHYGMHVDDILGANPGMSKTLKIGELVNIPYQKHNPAASGQGQSSGVAFHIVKPSETLFSISRKYGISIDDLRRWNNLESDALSPGMKLAVSNGMAAPEVAATTRKPSSGTVNGKVHIVKPSETLFSISRRYGVSVQQIKDWNRLSGNALNIGQKLFVSAPESIKETKEVNSSMLPAGTVAGKEATAGQGTNPPVESQAVVAGSGAGKQQNEEAEKTEERPDQSEDDVKTYEPAEKTIERGMAEVIDDASDSRKYLALHRTAPIGTIMQIKNEMNDQIVFVRVVGRIPDTGDNDKVLIKISKKAYDRLGALDKRFPVVISYVK